MWEILDNKDIQIEHCPTHLMLADLFTKTLQGQICFSPQRHNNGLHSNTGDT